MPPLSPATHLNVLPYQPNFPIFLDGSLAPLGEIELANIRRALPAANPIPQQRVTLPEHTRKSFLLDQACCSDAIRTKRLTANCAMARKYVELI